MLPSYFLESPSFINLLFNDLITIHLSNFDNLIESFHLSFTVKTFSTWNVSLLVEIHYIREKKKKKKKKKKKFIPSAKWAGWKERRPDPWKFTGQGLNVVGLTKFPSRYPQPSGSPCCTVKSRPSVRNPSRLRVCLGICESRGTERDRERGRKRRWRGRGRLLHTLRRTLLLQADWIRSFQDFTPAQSSGSRDATNPVF